MNDTELDEILDQWKVPPPSPHLREGLLAALSGIERVYPRARAPRSWISTLRARVRPAVLAAAVLIVGLFLFSMAEALSQTPPPGRIPYTVESEYLISEDGGPPALAMVTTSYNAANGGETVISRSIPDDQLRTMLGRKLDVLLPVWQRMLIPFVVSPKELEMSRKRKASGFYQVIPGCADANCLLLQHWNFPRSVGGTGTTACMEGKVVGVETILGHPTTAVQTNSRPSRLTMWLAPDLGCFALRIHSETMRPDGSFHIWQIKQALKVTMNSAQQ